VIPGCARFQAREPATRAAGSHPSDPIIRAHSTDRARGPRRRTRLRDGNEITGVIDWSEASQGDALFDFATLTLGHEEHLDDVLAGYGTDVDCDLIRTWQSWRCLVAVRWLFENGYDPPDEHAVWVFGLPFLVLKPSKGVR
jgi:hypothetical protein